MKQGFTLVELLVSVTILVIIGAIGVAVSEFDLQRGTLDAERDALQGALVKARSEAMANLNESPHGVAVIDNNFVIFQGSSYAGRDEDFDAEVPRLGSFAVSGPSEIVFQALDGSVAASSTFAIQGDAKTLYVSVNEEGRIQW